MNMISTTHSAQHPAEALILARLQPAVKERAAAVRLMVFDVDGVLTDGSLYYGEHGELFKRFNALDGHGLRLLAEGGIAVALITGRSGPIVDRRAAELGIAEVMQGVRDKGSALAALAQRGNVTLDQTGYMGDDICRPCSAPVSRLPSRTRRPTWRRARTGFPACPAAAARCANAATCCSPARGGWARC
jgi:3-deoxy-D-manno-octulosonate 8-phosphate phosphatase (KDO 8-P phosphatase)